LPGGYPVLSQDTLPAKRDYRLELMQGALGAKADGDPLSISQSWPHNCADGSNPKLWAAQIAPWQPNLVALDRSSFKCGHDAPINQQIEALMRRHRPPISPFASWMRTAPAVPWRSVSRPSCTAWTASSRSAEQQ